MCTCMCTNILLLISGENNYSFHIEHVCKRKRLIYIEMGNGVKEAERYWVKKSS